MIACPPIILGEHYRIGRRWAVMMTADVSTPLPITAAPLDFLSGDQRLVTWDGERLHVLAGYACDGYSPVIRLCGRWIRITPIPPAGLWPAILHDALRQFVGVPGCPWNRRNSDDWFYDALITGGIWRHHAGLYHAAVAGPVGSAWLHLTLRPDPSLRIIAADPPRTSRVAAA